jgi:hypothetical protein
MDAASRVSVAGVALGQEDMIHAAGAQYRIVQADGNAGTQQGVQNDRRPARRDFTDVEAYPIPASRVSSARSRRPRRLGSR